MEELIAMVLTALKVVIFVDVIASWVLPDPSRFPRNITGQITDPLYAPIRALIKPEKTGGLDLSPLLVLVLIQFMESTLHRGF
ncbi:MAG: YggT family protein [Myxococcales bacterium]|nr:YggT family protein [Myxococcales bacterium]